MLKFLINLSVNRFRFVILVIFIVNYGDTQNKTISNKLVDDESVTRLPVVNVPVT